MGPERGGNWRVLTNSYGSRYPQGDDGSYYCGALLHLACNTTFYVQQEQATLHEVREKLHVHNQQYLDRPKGLFQPQCEDNVGVHVMNMLQDGVRRHGFVMRVKRLRIFATIHSREFTCPTICGSCASFAP